MADQTTTFSPPVSRSRPKPLLSNAMWSALTIVWSMGVTIFLTPVLISHIGDQHYGLFILLSSIGGLLGILNLGLGEATLRYVAYHYGQNDLAGINRVMGATLSVYLVTGGLGWVVLFFGAPWFIGLLAVPASEYELGIALLRLTAIAFGLSLPGGVIGAIPLAIQRNDLSSKLFIAMNMVQVAGSVTIALSGLGIYALMLWNVITAAFSQVVNILLAKWLIPHLRLWPWPTRQGLREVFSYGVFSLITQVLSIIWGQVDRLMLAAWVSAASVAYLTVPQSLSFRFTFALSNISEVLLPRFSATQDRQELRRLFLLTTWITQCTTVILFVPLTVLMPDLLRLWINPDFSAQSTWVGQIIAFSCLIRGGYIPSQALLKSSGKPQFVSLVYLGSGLTSLVLDLVLIPTLGLAGAGYCYIATTGWGVGMLLAAWKLVLGEKNWFPLLRATAVPFGLGLLILPVAVTVRSQVTAPGWLGLVTLGVMFAGSALLLLVSAEWLWGGQSSHVLSLLQIGRRYFAGISIFKGYYQSQ